MTPDPPPAAPSADPIQSPLTLVLKLEPGSAAQVRAGIEHHRPTIRAALDRLKTVHFARFVLLENDTRLAVITVYDGDFKTYIEDFVAHLGDVFDALLAFVEDWPQTGSVRDRVADFAEFVLARDVAPVAPLFGAYPGRTVTAILGSPPRPS